MLLLSLYFTAVDRVAFSVKKGLQNYFVLVIYLLNKRSKKKYFLLIQLKSKFFLAMTLEFYICAFISMYKKFKAFAHVYTLYIIL